MLSLFAAANAFHVPSVAPRASAVRMATGNDGVKFADLDGSEVRIGIVKARWHEDIVGDLIGGAKEAFKEMGVKEENIIETEVPGAFELPLASKLLAISGTVDVVLPVGVLIKGETTHFEVISESVTSALMQTGLATGLPVIFGVLTAMTEEQAVARSTGANNHGTQWGKAAVEMALLRKSALGGQKKTFMGFGEEDSSKGSAKPEQKIGF